MTMSADSPDELDALLAHWADRYRMSEARAAEIRDTILASTTATTDFDWWWSLLNPAERLFGRSAAPPPRPRSTPVSWLSDMTGYRPYLRLA